MDRTIISLIGVADTLKHLLEHHNSTKRSKDRDKACERLETLRNRLLKEGVHYSQMVGAARDLIFDLTTQLPSHLKVTRGIEWVVQGLQSINIEDVQPPPLPPSSSSGPQSVSPEAIRAARALAELASAGREFKAQALGINRLGKSKPTPLKSIQAKDGPTTRD